MLFTVRNVSKGAAAVRQGTSSVADTHANARSTSSLELGAVEHALETT